jgi:hypothetical protein
MDAGPTICISLMETAIGIVIRAAVPSKPMVRGAVDWILLRAAVNRCAERNLHNLPRCHMQRAGTVMAGIILVVLLFFFFYEHHITDPVSTEDCRAMDIMRDL